MPDKNISSTKCSKTYFCLWQSPDFMKRIYKFWLVSLLLVPGLFSCAYHYQEEEEKIGPEPPACDTAKVFVYADVSPIFDSKCKACHEGGDPDLSDYSAYKTYISANRAKFEAAIQFTGNHPMPKGGPKLEEADICKILSWIKKGVKP